jgi:quinol-cytochrome oxidoreductase complex cytochrome b subunit
MSTVQKNLLIYGLILFLGIVLTVWGIIAGKHGATVVGIIVAGVNAFKLFKWFKKGSENPFGSE